jgi:hypothetical protein
VFEAAGLRWRRRARVAAPGHPDGGAVSANEMIEAVARIARGEGAVERRHRAAYGGMPAR